MRSRRLRRNPSSPRARWPSTSRVVLTGACPFYPSVQNSANPFANSREVADEIYAPFAVQLECCRGRRTRLFIRLRAIAFLTGTVTDAGGAVLPGVTLRITE